MENEEKGQWAIIELLGHKVIAGYLSKDESFGIPLLRIDIPETSSQPAFSRHYSSSALYGITYVSEEVARMTAEQCKENPVTVYVPNLSKLAELERRSQILTTKLENLRKQLPEPESEVELIFDEYEPDF